MKKKFTPFERYAIWKCHEERCWICRIPLSFKELSIDHFIPEKLLTDKINRVKVLEQYDIKDNEFNINGYENLLPSHSFCNGTKSSNVFKYIPENYLILSNLISKAGKVKEMVEYLSKDKKKNKIFLPILNYIETGLITFDDIKEFIKPISEKVNMQIIPDNILVLENGYWIFRKDIKREGYCKCERNNCVESNKKIYCYFPSNLENWVITKGLYFKCYDEIIICPKCGNRHKRGHIGKINKCDVPYKNQKLQIY